MKPLADGDRDKRSCMGRVPKSLLVAALVLHLAPLATRPSLIGGDEPHFALLAHSIAVDGDVDLSNDYDEVAAGSSAAGERWAGTRLERHVRKVGGRIVPSHPLGLPILVAPFLVLLNAIAPGSPPDLLLLGLTSLVTFVGLLAGWSLLCESTGPRNATLVTFAVYFATPLWFTSRTFFAEPWIWAVAVLAIAAFRRGRDLAGGVGLAILFWLKESTALIIVVVLAALLVSREKKRTMRAGIPLAIGVALWCWKNLALYGEPFVTYQRFQYGSIIHGAWGLLFSASHGILFFAPVAVVAALGWVLPRDRFTMTNSASLVLVSAAFVLTAAWIDWSGGSCFGPRLMVPAIAALAIPLATLLHDDRARRWVGPALYATVIAGFALEAAAAAKPFTAFWSESWPRLLADQPIAAIAGASLAAWLLSRISRMPAGRGDRSDGREPRLDPPFV